jgi:shikimate dehydrogenase
MFAEVIGDPVAQSKSPIIHRHWLERRGIEGDYLRSRVPADELAHFLACRRRDPEWRGCNVTIPHKQAILPLLDRIDPPAAAIGAVNCVVPEGPALVGYNSDVDGVEAALGSTHLGGAKAVIIGGGGAARAVLSYLASRCAASILVLVRRPERAAPLRALAAIEILPVERAHDAFAGASALINASPLGMAGAGPMPEALLEGVRRAAAGATVFDLDTTPVETEFLAAGREGGGLPVDGLTMLMGQAAPAFERFFHIPAPVPGGVLRRLLSSGESA